MQQSQPAGSKPAIQVKATRMSAGVFLNFVGQGTDLTIRTNTGMASEVVSAADDMESRAMQLLKTAALMRAGAAVMAATVEA